MADPMKTPSGARLPRVYQSHKGPRARAYRAAFVGLEKTYGPFDDVTRPYAATVAAHYAEWQASSWALEHGRQLRDRGQGRRPNAAAIARLQKRVGLAWQSYDFSLRRLEELCGRSRNGQPAPTPAELLRQARREAGLDA